METQAPTALDEQIDRWRTHLQRRPAIDGRDVAELEDHLREQVAALTAAGLAQDEAFLIAVKRMGSLDAVSREFALEHSERLWKQLVMPTADAQGSAAEATRLDALRAFGFAVLAAAGVKLLMLLESQPGRDDTFLLRNATLVVLAVLVAYFALKRGLTARALPGFAAAFGAAAGFANLPPFVPGGDTMILSTLHLPIALWLAVGVAYAGARWRDVAGRMDFIRFSGELFIYFVLIALGGGLLVAFTALIFQSIGVDIEPVMEQWIPCAPAGALVVAAWLVEAKQSVIENMAPVLTRLFTPLFAAVLLVFLGTVAFTDRGLDVQRELLIAFDLLLVLVLCLLLYSISARDPDERPGLFDLLQVVLVVSALLANGVALWAIATRIGEFGFSPNKIAALGENLILLANLTGSAVLYLRFLRGRAAFGQLERWQVAFLPVYAAWAATVVIAFPPLFRFA